MRPDTRAVDCWGLAADAEAADVAQHKQLSAGVRIIKCVKDILLIKLTL